VGNPCHNKLRELKNNIDAKLERNCLNNFGADYL
jgi:hypothetical protein